MKQINTEIIKSLKPCANRYKVWLENYVDFDGSLLDFLELDKISAKDKIWVAVRVMPIDLIELFAVDCAFRAANYADDATAAASAAGYAAVSAHAAGAAADRAAANSAASAAYAAYAANYSADAADYAGYASAATATAGAAAAERENQVDALIMLIKSEGE